MLFKLFVTIFTKYYSVKFFREEIILSWNVSFGSIFLISIVFIVVFRAGYSAFFWIFYYFISSINIQYLNCSVFFWLYVLYFGIVTNLHWFFRDTVLVSFSFISIWILQTFSCACRISYPTEKVESFIFIFLLFLPTGKSENPNEKFLLIMMINFRTEATKFFSEI